MTSADYIRCIEAGGLADAHVELVDGELVDSGEGSLQPRSPVRSVDGVRPYRVSADDYLRMIDAGIFGDAHVELIEGELIEMAPSGMEHSGRNGDVALDLGAIYRPLGFRIHIDPIIKLADDVMRAPDVAVVDQKIGGGKHLSPVDILLAVEIADSTLVEDLGPKRIDYASAGIRHYWVVDIAGKRTHCFTDPQGADYAAILVVPFGGELSVPGAEASIIVS